MALGRLRFLVALLAAAVGQGQPGAPPFPIVMAASVLPSYAALDPQGFLRLGWAFLCVEL